MIKFENVSLTYENKIILKNFNLEIKPEEKILIKGKSGNGKSTFIKLILGFEDIDEGEIFIKGKKVVGRKFNKTRHQFAYVNQDVSIEAGKVSDILSRVGGFKHNKFNGTIDIPDELTRLFDFDRDLLFKDVSMLSGGERQRLGIIMAILLDRPVYLLDEVTSGLDKKLKEVVVDYFSKIKQTVIVVSHDTEWSQSGLFKEVTW